jgi:hypothetical protein
MNEVVGYAHIKGNTTTGMSPLSLDKFEGKIVRVLEFGHDDCVLVIDGESSGLATFDKCDVALSFKCTSLGDYLMPPNLNEIEKMVYMSKIMARKGGYNPFLKKMVIAASLAKGEFHDNFLFA